MFYLWLLISIALFFITGLKEETVKELFGEDSDN